MDIVSRAVTLLASFAAIAPGPANAQPIVFAKGDSSFSALIYKDSRFAKGDMLVESVQNGLWLDSATIYQLDLSAVPGVQLDSARTLARRLIEESNVGAVIMFVVDQEFDLKRFWLGVPYNKSHFRFSKGSWAGNWLGPPGGLEAISLRDSPNVPPLEVEPDSNHVLHVKGGVQLVFVSIGDSQLQRKRIAVHSDGSSTVVEFNYKPTERVCFEEGDAFFLAKADPLLSPVDGKMTLEYPVFPRKILNELIPTIKGARFTSKDILTGLDELPIRTKGRHLVVSDVLHSSLRKATDLIQTKSKDRQWFVFVFDKRFDLESYGIGHRYNATPFDKSASRPLKFEYVDCLFPADVFPGGRDTTPLPPQLNVSWKGDSAEVVMSDVKLLLVQHWDDVLFSQVPGTFSDPYIQIIGGEVQMWSKGRLTKSYLLGTD